MFVCVCVRSFFFLYDIFPFRLPSSSVVAERNYYLVSDLSDYTADQAQISEDV